jgi:hypothetical protein
VEGCGCGRTRRGFGVAGVTVKDWPPPTKVGQVVVILVCTRQVNRLGEAKMVKLTVLQADPARISR